MDQVSRAISRLMYKLSLLIVVVSFALNLLVAPIKQKDPPAIYKIIPIQHHHETAKSACSSLKKKRFRGLNFRPGR